MIQLQVDSAAIQEIIQTGAGVGLQFLPSNFQILAPAISSILTIITAAIIRFFEKKRIERERKKELRDIVQTYLDKDNTEFEKIIEEIQKKDL